MVVLRIILGILVIIVGMDCVMNPALATLTVGWMASIVMFVCGVFAVIHFIEDKNREKLAKRAGLPYFGAGAGTLVLGIASIILSIVAMSSADGAVTFYKIIFVLFGLFIIFRGVVQVVAAWAGKKIGASGWLPMMILGIMVVLFGIFCIVDIFVSIVAVGTMVGIGFLFYGIDLIVGN